MRRAEALLQLCLLLLFLLPLLLLLVPVLPLHHELASIAMAQHDS